VTDASDEIWIAPEIVDLIHPGGRSLIVYSKEGALTGVLGLSAARAVMRMRPLVAAGAPVRDALKALDA
jgi:hypothetical protein